MDVIIMLVLLVALGVGANRWGYDSRDRPLSQEEILAAAGYAWRGRGPGGV